MSKTETFSNSIDLAVINEWAKKKCCHANFNSGSAGLPCCLLKGLLQRDFLDIYLTTLSEFVILQIQNLWASWFLSKYSKFHLYFINELKNWQKVLCFSDNSIWIGIVKLYLLKTGHFSSPANVLESRPKIWQLTSRDFLQLNSLSSDQWIW